MAVLFAFGATLASGAPFCETVFSGSQFVYPKIVEALQPKDPHTISDTRSYLRDKLGAESLHALTRGADVVIQLGPGRNPFAGREDVKLSEIANPFGAFNSVVVSHASGAKTVLFTNVNGESRRIQLLSFLRLANVDSTRIEVIGREISYHGLYLKTFRKIDHVPDVVVFGFANTAAEVLAAHRAAPEARARFLRANKDYSDGKWKKARFDAHELAGMGIQVLSLENGRKIWLIDNEYGDRAGVLVRALQDHGVKNIILFGTAGALNSDYKIGDWVSPRAFRNESRIVETRRSLSMFPKKGVHGDVESPGLETKAWLAEQIRRGVDYVEVEAQKVTREIRPNVRFQLYLVISDLLVGAHTADYTKWSEADRQATKPRIKEILDHTLAELGVVPRERLTEYEIVPFQVGDK